MAAASTGQSFSGRIIASGGLGECQQLPDRAIGAGGRAPVFYREVGGFMPAGRDTQALCDNFYRCSFLISMTEIPMKTLLLIIAAAFALAACNTVQGVGKDIEKGGEAIQKATK